MNFINLPGRAIDLDLETSAGGGVCAAAPGTVFACGAAGILTPMGILTPEMVPARRLRPAKLSINGAAGQTETDVILRTAILDRKVDLYKGLWAKVNQCGGNGQCATCIVEVTAGANKLSPKTPFELDKLKSKPASYRLACQTLINGDVAVIVP